MIDKDRQSLLIKWTDTLFADFSNCVGCSVNIISTFSQIPIPFQTKHPLNVREGEDRSLGTACL